MSPRRFLAGLLPTVMLVLAGCMPPQNGPADSESAYWNPPALSDDSGEIPDGRAVIERMLEFMRSHGDLAAEALMTYEAVQESGQKLHFDRLHRVAFSKSAKKFLWVTLRDDGTTDTGWISDGKFTIIKQPANLYGQIDGPVAIGEMIEMLTDDYGVDVPFSEVVGGGAAELWLGDQVTSVLYVGEAFIGGRWTDQVAIRKPGVDFEIWVTQGDTPYPARIAGVFTDIEGMPSYTLEFQKYSTVLPSPESLNLDIPEDAERVELAPIVD